jgi:hypothetical protein
MREYSGALFHVIPEAAMHCFVLLYFKALARKFQDSLPPD